MKRLLHIIASFLVISCSAPPSQPVNDSEQKVSSPASEPKTLHGLWVMSDYIDSILTYKTISKYRMQWPTWFAILIDIDEDSLRSYGSILDIETPYNPQNDTLHVFENTMSGQWTLVLNQQTKKLELINTDNGKNMDPKVYVFEQRPDLGFLLDTLDQVHRTRTSMTSFFNSQLIAGTYELIGTNDEIILRSDGKIVGFQDFDKYEIDVYYGTLHPYDNLDNIVLQRRGADDSIEAGRERFHWEFKGDTLILTQFNWDEYNVQGTRVWGDVWTLSDKQIQMIKK